MYQDWKWMEMQNSNHSAESNFIEIQKVEKQKKPPVENGNT